MKAEGSSISVENPVDDFSINLYSKGPPREVNLGLNFGDCYVGLEKVFCFITLSANMYSRHCFVLLFSDENCLLEQLECIFG